MSPRMSDMDRQHSFSNPALCKVFGYLCVSVLRVQFGIQVQVSPVGGREQHKPLVTVQLQIEVVLLIIVCCNH